MSDMEQAPQQGGSYIRDPETGALLPVEPEGRSDTESPDPTESQE